MKSNIILSVHFLVYNQEKTISQTINHVIGLNFSDYVNSYRIADARLKLEQETKESLSIKNCSIPANLVLLL